jgi:hypothetical protein
MKKLSKKLKIFITAMIVLVGSFYGYYKANNRNAFEEMFNSYYNFVPTTALYNMPQIEAIPKKLRNQDVVTLNYKENNTDSKVDFTLANNDVSKTILIQYTICVSEGVNLCITYDYDINSYKLSYSLNIYGERVPYTKNKETQIRELLEKHNISKEQLQKISDDGLDKVLTDWKNYSGSSYSKDNMGRLTIEKDEFLR